MTITDKKIKVGEYTFTEPSSQIIRLMIEETHKNNIEFGGLLCAKLDSLHELYIDNIFSGTEVSIKNVERICEKGKIVLGDFHTHTYKYEPEEFVFSPEDLYYVLDNDITGVGFIDGTLVFAIRILKDDKAYLEELVNDNITLKSLIYNFDKTEEEDKEYTTIEDKIYYKFTSIYITHI